MKIDRIGTCVAALVYGFFLMAAVSECDARDPRRQDPPDTAPGGPISVPIVSPDGSYIIFPYNDHRHHSGPRPRIFSVYTDGSQLYQIPDGPSAPEYFLRDYTPDISPDGSRVVYSTFRHSTGMPWNRVHSYEIATADPDGSDVKRLTRNEYDDRSPVWSPDGLHIAFISSRDDGPSPGVYTSGIYIMNSDGSDMRRIATRGSGHIYPKLVWSPNGLYIVFRDFDGIGWGGSSPPVVHFVAIVGLDGSGLRRIMESDSPISEPAWSPDGRHLAFFTTKDKIIALYIADSDGLNLRQVVAIPMPEPSQIEQQTMINNPRISWDSGGSEILVRYSDGIKNFMHSVRPDGSGFRTLQERITGTAVSVDGSRLIVYSRPEGRDGEVVLYTTALDGSDKRILVRYAYGELVAENSAWEDNAPTCSNGGAVSDPGGNPGLVQDCETLLSIRDTLSGEDVELNWQAYTPIEDWWGISIGGSPLRVDGFGYPKPIGFELRGTIPPEIGDLTGLKNIALDGTQLTGPIPPELGNLAGLERLRLTTNRLSGSIPAELGNLENLKELYLQFNALTGEIPVELGNLENLQELYLHSNDLSGCIPSTIRLSRPNLSVDVGLEPC